MSRRLDIGVASFKSPEKLRRCIQNVQRFSTTDWRLIIVHNDSHDQEGDDAYNLAEEAARNSNQITTIKQENTGYAGAVNSLLNFATTEYIAYLDNDAYVQTPAWDETLCSYLDRFHEIGWIFPGEGSYLIDRGAYKEVMWATGFCWVINRLAVTDTGKFDAEIGHQEEADYALRLRMAGYKCACANEVSVEHDATATSDPTSIERINRGIVNWVNKWNRYFNGKNFNYHSPNVTRWDDWPPNALYLEEWWKGKLPGLNDSPEKVTVDGRVYDLLRVPRIGGFYGGRVI